MSRRRIEYAKRQFEISKTYALYWQAMATTGAVTQRDSAQGREPTLEERAQGLVLGFTPDTNERKIQKALDTMQRHIQNMTELNDTIDELTEEEERKNEQTNQT